MARSAIVKLLIETLLLSEHAFVIFTITQRLHPIGSRASLNCYVRNITAHTLLIARMLVIGLHLLTASTSCTLCAIPDASTNFLRISEVAFVEGATHAHASAHHVMIVVVVHIIEVAALSKDLAITAHVLIRHAIALLLLLLLQLTLLRPDLLLHHAIQTTVTMRTPGFHLLIHHVWVVRKSLLACDIILSICLAIRP